MPQRHYPLALQIVHATTDRGELNAIRGDCIRESCLTYLGEGSAKRSRSEEGDCQLSYEELLAQLKATQIANDSLRREAAAERRVQAEAHEMPQQMWPATTLASTQWQTSSQALLARSRATRPCTRPRKASLVRYRGRT